MSEPTYKPHYFEVAMRSVSGGVVNQEIILLKEYASTPGELTVKQMWFTKSAGIKIIQAIIDAMDEQSRPIQELGQKELMAAMEEWGGGKPAKGKSKK